MKSPRVSEQGKPNVYAINSFDKNEGAGQGGERGVGAAAGAGAGKGENKIGNHPNSIARAQAPTSRKR
jgi:hypothetical protein